MQIIRMIQTLPEIPVLHVDWYQWWVYSICERVIRLESEMVSRLTGPVNVTRRSCREGYHGLSGLARTWAQEYTHQNHGIKRRVLIPGTSINVRRVQPSSEPK